MEVELGILQNNSETGRFNIGSPPVWGSMTRMWFIARILQAGGVGLGALCSTWASLASSFVSVFSVSV